MDTRWRWRLPVYASLVEDTISLADLGIPEVANGFGVCEGESWLGLDNQQGVQIAGSRESVGEQETKKTMCHEKAMSWHAVDGGVWTINLIIIALLQIKRVRDDAKMVNVRRWDERIDYGGCLSHEACCEGVGLVCSEGARKVPMSNRVFLKQGRWIFWRPE